MLLEFRVKNFRSFKDEQTFSMVASSTESLLPENVLKQEGYESVKTAAIYGANASGKSNLLKAVDYFVQLIKKSTSPQPGEKMSFTPFLMDTVSQNESTEFEINFYFNKIRYQYSFAVTAQRITEEGLFGFPYGESQKFPFGRPQRWFSRTYNVNKNDYDWTWGTYLKGEKEKLAQKTLENALFLSVGAQWNNEQLATVYSWITEKIRVIFPKDNLRKNITDLLLHAQEQEPLKKDFYHFLTSFLQRADLGIQEVIVKKTNPDEFKIKFPKDMPNSLQEKLLNDFNKSVPIAIEFLHLNKQTNETMTLPIKDESDGTQRFFELIGVLFDMFIKGYIIFVDEMERSMHPLLMKELLKIFTCIPNSSGQLVFTTHDTTQLDSEVFRRDQIWFTEKDQSGASKLYPLSDYKPRKEEALEKGYLSGRYGAIPILEEFGING